MKDWKLYIGGEWATTDEVREARRSYDHAVLGRVALAGSAEMDRAIAAASAAFPAMKALTAAQRYEILTVIATSIEARKEEFARSISDECGKPIRDARTEVERATLVFSLSAEATRQPYGELLPLDLTAATAGRLAITRRFPAGPVGAITPFNFPLNLAVHKIGPAIAAGCPIVLKPAEKTPLTALLLAEVIDKTALPKGAFNVVVARDPALGELLATDPRIKVLSFTGAAGVGWRLKSLANRKRVTLELGGNAGVIVHQDADIARAVSRCITGAFGYAGQICISVQRIYVHRPIWDEFVPQLVAGAQTLVPGDPADDATTFVPMITEAAAEAAEARVRTALDQGAKALLFGERDGATLGPTILTNTTPEMAVCAEEVFAPIVVVEPYDDFADALDMVNAGSYGLQAGVFTQDIGRLFQAFSALEVGGVIGNDIPTFRADSMPYGGEKDSGFGREGVRYAIEEMTEPRILALALQR